MHGALQGQIAMEQPWPRSCGGAGGSLGTLSAGPTWLPWQPLCCRDRDVFPPEPRFSCTQAGSRYFDGSPGPQHPPGTASPGELQVPRRSSLPSISLPHRWWLWAWSPEALSHRIAVLHGTEMSPP